MAKIDSIAERFQDLISEEIANRTAEKRSWALGTQFGLLQGAAVMRPKIDWSNRQFWAVVAETSLRLSDHYMHGSLKSAFDMASLDPDDPESWATLLRIFAFAHFGPPKTKREGKKGWDWRKWTQLLADFAAVKLSHPTLSDVAVCTALKKRFQVRYSDYNAGTIRRNLQYARDVKHNEYLEVVSDTFAKSLQSTAIKRGRKISPSAIRSQATAKAIKKIAIEWKTPS